MFISVCTVCIKTKRLLTYYQNVGKCAPFFTARCYTHTAPTALLWARSDTTSYQTYRPTLFTVWWDHCCFRKILKAQYTPPTQLNCTAACTEFATSWRQSRRVSTSLNNLPTTKSSCVVSAVWKQPSPVVTQQYSRRARTHRRHNSTWQDKFSICSVSKFSSAVVGSRRELIANSIHTADADATPTRRRRDSTRQLSRVGVGGMYWA